MSECYLVVCISFNIFFYIKLLIIFSLFLVLNHIINLAWHVINLRENVSVESVVIHLKKSVS